MINSLIIGCTLMVIYMYVSYSPDSSSYYLYSNINYRAFYCTNSIFQYSKSEDVPCGSYFRPSLPSACSPESPHKASSVWTPDSCPSAGTVWDTLLDTRRQSGCPLASPSLLTACSHYQVTRDYKKEEKKNPTRGMMKRDHTCFAKWSSLRITVTGMHWLSLQVFITSRLWTCNC